MVGLAIAYIAAWSFANFVSIRPDPYGIDALQETVSALIIWTAMLFAGGFFAFDAVFTRKLMLISSALIVAALIHSMFRFGSPLGPYLTFSTADPDSPQSSYQGIGRSILVTFIVFAAVARKAPYRLAIFATGSFLLLLVGSRSDLFAMLALAAVLAFQSTFTGRNRLATIVSMSACVALLYLASPLFFETRNVEIFDLSGSSSWQARQELQAAALQIIRDDPFFGSFGYHMRDGGSGWYAHNALSAWTNYGLLGFVLYTGLICYFTLISVRHVFSHHSQQPVWFAALYLNLAALIQATLASPVFFPLPALGWGVALNALRGSAADGASRLADESAHPLAAVPPPLTPSAKAPK
jgi:hypothetical protein